MKSSISLLLVSLFLMSCASSDIFQDIGTNISNPVNVTFDPALARAYLISGNTKVEYKNGSVQVLDITNPAVPVRIGNKSIDSFSGHSYLDATNKYLYLANRLSDDNLDNTDQILRINVDEASASFLAVESFPNGANPFGMVFDVTSANIYVATTESALDYFALGAPGSISTIDLTNLNLSDGTTLAASSYRDVAIFGTQAFLTRPQGGILVVDLTEKNADYFISNSLSPRAVMSDGTNIYVTSIEDSGGALVSTLLVLDPALLPVRTGNTDVQVIDKATILTAEVEVGTDPQELALSTNYIFVSNMGADTVSVINRPVAPSTDFTKGTDITVGDEPFGLGVYSPGGVDTHLFVTNVQTGSVSIIDLATLGVVGTYSD